MNAVNFAAVSAGLIVLFAFVLILGIHVALRNVNSYTGFGGLIPPYSTTHQFTGLGGTLPYLYNVDLAPARLVNGKVTQISNTFIDPFTGKTTSG